MRRVGSLTACLLALVLVVSACNGDGDEGMPANGENGAPSGQTDGGDDLNATNEPGFDTLSPVGVGDEADFGDGLFATVTSVEPVELEAIGPRDIAGPGAVVTLELRNGGTEVVDLAALAINARYGDGDGTPAPPNVVAPEPGLEGLLEPGERRTGQYAFRVPHDEIGSLVLDVHHAGSPNVVIVDAGATLG